MERNGKNGWWRQEISQRAERNSLGKARRGVDRNAGP